MRIAVLQGDGIGAEAARLSQAVDAAYASGAIHSFEAGGKDGTQTITAAVIDALGQTSAPA